MRKKDVLNWIEKYGEISKRICGEEGVPFQLCWAQAMLESGAGKNILAQHHNYFGIKYRESVHSHYVEKETWEWKNGKKVYGPAKFASFDSDEDGFRGYAQFIKRSRYQHELLGLLLHDPVRYLTWLWARGYATAQNYVPGWVGRARKIYAATGDPAFDVSIDAGLAGCLGKLKAVTGKQRWEMAKQMLERDGFGRETEGNWLIEAGLYRAFVQIFAEGASSLAPSAR